MSSGFNMGASRLIKREKRKKLSSHSVRAIVNKDNKNRRTFM